MITTHRRSLHLAWSRLALSAVALGTCLTANGQSWAGILSPSRAINWSKAGVVGGIPKRTIKCGATIAAYTGTADAINTALAACGANQYLELGAGTFRLSSGITFKKNSFPYSVNNVTLRGMGANRTFLIFTGGNQCVGLPADICMSGSNHYPGGWNYDANWTGGYASGATQLTLDDVTGIVAGQTAITVDQNDDANTDPGTIWVCQTVAVCSAEGPSGSGTTGRAQQQTVLVTAVNTTTKSVTISPGLYMPNWRASQSPKASWPGTTLVGSGVEDLSMDHLNSGNQAGVWLGNSYGCWLKGVRSVNSNRSHVWLYLSSHASVVDSYFYGTARAGSTSYGVEVFMGSDYLIQNNIFQHIAAGMIMNGAGSGTVWGYNYSLDGYYTPSPAWMSPSFMHSAGIDFALWEGNSTTSIQADLTHGSHHLVTEFRNYLPGWETGKSQQTIPGHLQAVSRYFNLVGNVMGTAGYHTGYQCVPTSVTSTCAGGNADKYIFAVGFSGNEGQHGPYNNDLQGASSMMRWGNYDTVSNANRFQAAEVPSGLSLLANPVPASQALPASFYLSGKPAWFGSGAWPAIGPDVANGTISGVGGHANKIPAQLCFEKSAADAVYGSGVVVFDPSACYASAVTALLEPPPGLQAVVN